MKTKGNCDILATGGAGVEKLGLDFICQQPMISVPSVRRVGILESGITSSGAPAIVKSITRAGTLGLVGRCFNIG
jgi:hypothetical protein